MSKTKYLKKSGVVALSAAMFFGSGLFDQRFISTLYAAEDFTGILKNVESASIDSKNKNIVYITFNDGVKGKITFLDNGLFRYNVDPSGEFSEYATPNNSDDIAKIQAQSDSSDFYAHPEATIEETDASIIIKSNGTSIIFDKATAKMKLLNAAGEVVMQEAKPLSIGSQTEQTLVENDDEYFYGGGTQNGRFSHKGESIKIKNESAWTDGGVASPNPFYWSTNGYGVMRNTFKQGIYDFGKTNDGTVSTTHNEKEFDAYYFVANEKNASETADTILNDYYKVTGNPALLPEYAYYLAHLNCYNRDGWKPSDKEGSGWKLEDGNWYQELGKDKTYVIPEGTMAESLNNTPPSYLIDNFKGVINDDTYKFSARAVIEGHENEDMPLGWFLPNDGYGCGYGQNGYDVKRSDDSEASYAERSAAVDANVANLKSFTDFANAKGVQTGLWTQSALNPDDAEKDGAYRGYQFLRDFDKEVNNGGIAALKTDVAWVSAGYSFGLNSVRTGYNTLAKSGVRPTVVTLDGWAGTQRYGSIWTGDQTGGEWEYIRFHIPTYIGQSLSGNPNIGSDMNGIFGGDNGIIQTRDYQWKIFTQTMLDMDGWGSESKKPYAHSDPYKSINRMYLKMKAELMPYLYTEGMNSVNGLPAIRAMFLEFPEDTNAYGKNVQYQFMYGSNLLVAPVYEDVNGDEEGNDVRNGIYLPGGSDQVWIDYFTGKQYRGGQTLNNFDAPIWKLPLFVKNGAIVPMYEENNNPSAITSTNPNGLDKSKRVVEFWPEGETSYTAKEDDGLSLNFAENGEDRDTIDYGNRVTTTYTSKLDGNTATLTAEKSAGNYDGYNSNRKTTFVVNVQEKPTAIEAFNGTSKLNVVEASSLEEYEKLSEQADQTVYFYDKAPNLNKYSKDDENFKNTEITSSPKLYVKFATTNVNANEQKLVIKGFNNATDLGKEEVNENLMAPELSDIEDEFSPTQIVLGWNAIEDATSYDIEVDGVINNAGIDADGNAITKYVHKDLAYHTTHTYRVRARNANGFSEWSEEHTATSLEDPWRNAPNATATWDGGIYSGRTADRAVDHIMQGGDAGFHSDGNAEGHKLTIDLHDLYQLQDVEYYPRDDMSNGTTRYTAIEVSKDGKNWKTVYDGTTRNEFATVGIDNAMCETFDLSSEMARYVRITPLNTSFFSAREIVVNKVDGTNSKQLGSNTEDGIISDNSITQIKAYAGTDSTQASWNQVKNADLNYNNVYDVYDMAYTLFQMDGGTKKTGSVSGNIMLMPNKTTAKAGETFTIDLYGVDMQNVNGAGGIFEYDKTKYEYVEFKQSGFISQMENYTANYAKGDTGSLTVTLLNRGNKPVVSGTKLLGTITMKALVDGDTYQPAKAMLIGPDYSLVETDSSASGELPDIPMVTETLYKADAFNKTITNKDHETDDGTNINSFINGGSNDKWNVLFNGTKNGANREFELNYNPTEDLYLPIDMGFEFKEPSLLSEVVLYNANRGNGYVNKAKAIFTFEDGTTETKEITEEMQEYHFAISNANLSKKVLKVDVIPMDTTTGKGMMTLSEIEFIKRDVKKIVKVEFDEANKDQVYVDALIPFKAKVTPDNPNPYYELESSDPTIAEVIRVQNGDEFNYYIKGIKAGEVDITAKAKGDDTKTATTKLTVVEGVDASPLEEAIDKAKEYKNIYTEETYNALQTALEEAYNLLNSEGYTIDQIADKTGALEMAMNNLVIRSVDKESLINTKELSKYVDIKDISSEADWDNNYAKYVLDYNDGSFWHSNYSDNYKLPQSITFDLGSIFALTDVEFLPRQDGSANGDIIKAHIEVSKDGKNFVNIGSFSFENDGKKLLDHDQFKQMSYEATEARYVKFVADEALGNTKNAYASMSEIRFYGSAVTANKMEMKAYYDSVKDVESDGYTPATWIPYRNALTDLEKAIANDEITIDEANAKMEAMKTAYENLTKSADKTELESKVKEAENEDVYDIHKYTPSTWRAFTNALKEASIVLNDVNAEQEKVNTAVDQLTKAMEGLVEKADFDKLFDTMKKAYALNADDYTATTWLAVRDELANAELVYADEEASQDRIDDAESRLAKAIDNLKKIEIIVPDDPTDPTDPTNPENPSTTVDKSYLNTLINEAKTIDLTKYTDASVSIFKSALASAEKVAKDNDADEKAVKNAYSTLNTAIKGLVAKQTTVPNGNEGTGTGTETGTNNPDTGDHTNTGLLASTLLLGGAAVATLLIKKRKEEEEEA